MDDIRELLKETDRLVKENAEQMKETDRRLKENAEQMKETDRRLKETDRQMEKLMEVSRKNERFIGNDARIVEDHFIKALTRLQLRIGDIVFDEIYDDLKQQRKLNGGMEAIQLDALLVNGSHTAILEVKKLLHVNDVHKVFNNTLPRFRRLFPKYRDKKLIVMVGAASANLDAVEAALGYGFVVLLQEGQDISIDTSHQKIY